MRVQAAIDRMNARVEGLVEDYNEAREALARTRVEQARQVEALAAQLAAQAGRQERLQARLAAQRRQIEARLAAQRRYPLRAAAGAAAFARRQLGKPYVWRAAGPSSNDCSGLVMAAYRTAGVRLPRVSRAQWHAGPGSAPAAWHRATWCSSPTTPATPAPSTMSVCTSATAPWSRPPIPGPGSASPPSAGDYIGAVRPTG